MEIIEDDPLLLPELVRLNEQWISELFQLEEGDHALAADPRRILRSGGHTFSMAHEGRVVGVVALFRTDAGFELARMAVEPAFRERGIGRALVNAALERAKRDGAPEITLMSNTKLTHAIALYRSLGFVDVGNERPGYGRCNILMRKTLSADA